MITCKLKQRGPEPRCLDNTYVFRSGGQVPLVVNMWHMATSEKLEIPRL